MILLSAAPPSKISTSTARYRPSSSGEDWNKEEAKNKTKKFSAGQLTLRNVPVGGFGALEPCHACFFWMHEWSALKHVVAKACLDSMREKPAGVRENRNAGYLGMFSENWCENILFLILIHFEPLQIYFKIYVAPIHFTAVPLFCPVFEISK